MLTAVHVPTTVDEALARLREGGTVLAGGTSLMPELNTHASPPTEVVSLRRAGLAGVRRDGPGGSQGGSGPPLRPGGSQGGSGPPLRDEVVVGTATTLSALAAAPDVAFLAEAVATIASPPVRNLATVGGNLFVKPPYGDLAVCLLALDARADVAGPGGQRQVPVADVLSSGVGADELVTAVRFPAPPPDGWRYRKAMRRRFSSASIVTVAAVLSVSGGAVTDARIALGGVAPRPLRATSAEQALVGGPLDRDRVEAAAAAAVDDADPFDDPYASAWYRARVLPVHVRRALLGE